MWLAAVMAAPNFAADPGITSSGSRQKLEQGRSSNHPRPWKGNSTDSTFPGRKYLHEKRSATAQIQHEWGKRKVLTGEILSGVFPV